MDLLKKKNSNMQQTYALIGQAETGKLVLHTWTTTAPRTVTPSYHTHVGTPLHAFSMHYMFYGADGYTTSPFQIYVIMND